MAMPIKLRLTAYALGLATLLSCFSIKAIADGMPITSAYVTGSGNTTGTSATAFTGVAAPAAGRRLFAWVQCKNSGATTSVVTLNDNAATVLIAVAGGGTDCTGATAGIAGDGLIAIAYIPVSPSGSYLLLGVGK